MENRYIIKKCSEHLKLFLYYFMLCSYEEQKEFLTILNGYDFDFWRVDNV